MGATGGSATIDPVGLLAIPPYLLTGDRPPSARGPIPAFHRRSYAIPEPIDFPRELFAGVLVEHERLLETHGTALLQAPLGGSGPDADDDPGELVASRVVCPVRPRNVRERVEALLALYDATLRSGLTAYGRKNPRRRRLAILQTSGDGEELRVLNRREAPAFLDDFPQIVEALRAVRAGLDAVAVDGYWWAALRWLPSGALDVAVPPMLHVRRKDDGEAEALLYAELPPKTPPKAELPLSNAELLAALPPSILRAARRRKTGILAACCVVCGLATIPPLTLFADVARSPDLAWGPATLVVLAGTAFLFACWMLVDHVRGTAYLYRGKSGDVRAVAARPPAPPRQDVRRVWMARLSRRLSYLERLVALDAPEPVVEHSREVVRKAIRELEPDDARAVLRAWPQAVKHLETGQSQKGEVEKPN